MNILTIRRWHSYIGLFTAPSVLFFSLTGALQLFSLHEAHGQYQPPALVERLSSVHKDQVFESGHHGPPPGAAPGAGIAPLPPGAGPPDDHDHDAAGMGTVLLKVFFLIVALALAVSTLFGLYIGLTRSTQRRVGWLLVIAGTAVPVLLLL